MKTFEVTKTLSGSTIEFIKADSESEVESIIENKYPDLVRYSKMSESQREKSILEGLKNEYSIYELSSEVLERKVKEYNLTITKLRKKADEYEKLLENLMENFS